MSDAEKDAPGGNGNVQEVRLGDILDRALGPDVVSEKGAIAELEPLQWIGFWLGIGFLVYIILASIAIFYICFYRVQLPPFPAPPANTGDVAQYRQLVDAYKTSADVYQQMAKLQVERAMQLFQLIVASTILPVFSALLGYIFGSKRSGD